ncbi:hypothetical protein GO755_30515 [Spirosoma sp. HMF4905]|uniref:Phage head morphogenesis domain-containing protein n=1 Tax=Spirosoma arboris TaxID=2682092 RepID=A0A7K1SKV1_9BACT|nr:phage minor head protein [Spirosoma arboris]MVM34405.1 hypothetical protein [Spirosoma arboris]
MNLQEQRRYALAFLRWYKRHERRAYRLVQEWLSGIKENLLAMLERIGLTGTIFNINDLVQIGSVRELLTRIYQHTLPEAAKREFERLRELIPQRTGRTITADVGFFSRVWQNTTTRLLSQADTASRITQIAETTRNQIRRVLVQANAENVDNREAARRISTVLGGKGVRTRSRLIARTETTRVASLGHEAGAMSTSLQLNKVWIATADTRTREHHRQMIGKKPVPKDSYFVVGGVKMKFPGDPAGGAKECCNCRCCVTYIPV